jgi:hypothetical protein
MCVIVLECALAKQAILGLASEVSIDASFMPGYPGINEATSETATRQRRDDAAAPT